MPTKDEINARAAELLKNSNYRWASEMEPSPELIEKLKGPREGNFQEDAYEDAGDWAIGYGMQYWKGKKVHEGMHITQEEADEEFDRQLHTIYKPRLDNALKIPVNQHQYDSLISVSWNSPAAGENLAKKMNAGKVLGEHDFTASATIKGEPDKGLIRRRKAEYADFQAPDDTPPVSDQRRMEPGPVAAAVPAPPSTMPVEDVPQQEMPPTDTSPQRFDPRIDPGVSGPMSAPQAPMPPQQFPMGRAPRMSGPAAPVAPGQPGVQMSPQQMPMTQPGPMQPPMPPPGTFPFAGGPNASFTDPRSVKVTNPASEAIPEPEGRPTLFGIAPPKDNSLGPRTVSEDVEMKEILDSLRPMPGPTVQQMRQFAQDHSKMGIDYTHPGQEAEDAVGPKVNTYMAPGDLAAASGRSAALGLAQAIIGPFGSLAPNTWKSLTLAQQEQQQKLKGYLSTDEMTKAMSGPFGPPTDTTRGLLTATPALAGEVVGSFIPGEPIIKGADKFARLAVKSPFARKFVAAAVGTTAFSAFANIEPGESRSVMIGKNLALFGAMDLAFRHIGTGLQEELGGVYHDTVDRVAKATGKAADQAEDALIAMRANPANGNIATAKAVINIGAEDANVRMSPLYNAAAKVYENEIQKHFPKNLVLDPMLGDNFGVKFNLSIGDQPLTPVHLTSNPQDHGQFAKQVATIREQISKAWEQGTPIKVDNIQIGNEGTKSRFLNLMYRPITDAKEMVPGAAKVNTAAFGGTMPKPGDTVHVVTADGTAVHTVVESPLPRTYDAAGTRPFVPGGTIDEATESLNPSTGRIHRKEDPNTRLRARVAAAPPTGVDQWAATESRGTGRNPDEEFWVDRPSGGGEPPSGGGGGGDEGPSPFTPKNIDADFTPREFAMDLFHRIKADGGTSYLDPQRGGKSLAEVIAITADRLGMINSPEDVFDIITRPRREVMKEFLERLAANQADQRQAQREFAAADRGMAAHAEESEVDDSVAQLWKPGGLADQLNQEMGEDTTKIYTQADLMPPPAPSRNVPRQMREETDEEWAERAARWKARQEEAKRSKKAVKVGPRQVQEEEDRNTTGHGFDEQGVPHVWTRDSKGNVQTVPLSSIVVRMPRPGEHLEISAHPDGSARHALIHVERPDYETQISMQGYGDFNPKSYFTSMFFKNVDHEQTHGNEVRAFFHKGGITLSVTPGEKIWEERGFYGDPIGEYGWLDSIDWRRQPSKPGYAGGGSATGHLAGSEVKPKLVKMKGGGTAIEGTRIGDPRPSRAAGTEQGMWMNAGAGKGEDEAYPALTKAAKEATKQQLSFGPVRDPTTGDLSYFAPRPKNEKWKPYAGFIPGPMRDERWSRNYYTGGWEPQVRPFAGRETRIDNPFQPQVPTPNVKYYRKGSAFAGKIKSVDSGETIPHAETSSRAAWKVRRGKEFTRMTPTKWDVEGEPIEMGPSIGISRMGPEDRPKQKPWPDFEIHPDYHGHAELADAIKSARILLRHGVDGDTPVAVMAAYTQHQPNWTSTRPWTVRELADHQPPQISLTRLRDEATPRGIETYVDGPRMILRAADGSWEKTFDSHLAAARFVEKMPGRVLDRPLDDAFEQALGIGKSRSFDADVDAGAFHKVDLQETATKELIAGKRPLIVLHGEDPTSISNAIRAIEMMNDLPPGTHTVLPLKGTGHGKNAVAIYDTLRARQMLGSVKEDVARLGVNTEQPFQDVLQELSNKKWGLAALFGRPEGPQQALHYSWLREHGMRESWTRGKLTQDSMGPYRTFDPNEILLSRRGGPGSMFAGGEPPPPYNPTLDLEDVIPGFHPDARMHMPPGPGMAEPEHPGWYGDMHPETEDATYHDWGWGKGDEAAEAAEATGGDAGGGGEGGGGGGLPTGPPDTPEQKRIAEGFKSVFSGPFNQLAHFFRVPAEMFKEWEVRSGIPFSTWFTAIEDRRSAVEATMGPLMENMHELFRGTTQDLREAAQQVFDAHATGKMQDIAHITDDAALALGEKAHEFFTRWMTETMGHSKEDVEALLKELPQIRKSGQSFSDYKGSRGLGLPKLLTTESKSFEKGAVILSNREMDVRKNLIRMGRAFTNEKEMMPTWSAISKAYQAYKMVDTPLTDSGAFTVFDSYIRSALHQQDHVSNTIANVFKKVAEKLEGIGVISDADATDFTSVILGAGYFANMAFGPGNVMRNALQTLQTGTGLGVGPWAHGFKQAMKYLRDPDFEQELLHRGIITRDRTAQMWADARGANEMIMNLEGSSSKIIANTTRLASMGTAPFKKVEDLNHIIAYYSQHQLAEKFGKQYHAGKITWDEFLEKSYIDMRDMKDGPTHRGIKEALDAGEIDVAADIASIDYMNATQFKYRRGVTPYWMQNTVGRMAGQYGTWPSYFAEYAYDSMTRGSVKNRMKVAARWAAANAAMYEIGSQAFGVDMGRWLFFSPFGYTGGPMVEVAGQALSTTNMLVQGQIDMTGQAKKGADPADAIALARFKNSWQQFVPLPTGQYNRTMRALDQIQLGDWSKGTKYFLGFPPIKDTY